MHEIKCPHCNTMFTIDEAGYADILSQVRDDAFDKAIHERLALAELDQTQAVELAEARITNQLQDASSKKDAEIARLKSELEMADVSRQLELANALRVVEKERDALRFELTGKNAEHQLQEVTLKDKYETQIKDRDDEIGRLKDMKARLSTKMVGETLEQHCEIEFNKIRATAFPHAYFEKDNDASSGSKGDYIFRESDATGVEFISIMFEMKNESDATSSKKKNEDFFKELDKDRTEKGCEYALLVSLLEPDSELYNSGIVDVSYRYPKMYVIRPQFFIPMITLLRNAALNSLTYKTELQQMKAQNIDITNFEEQLETFKSGFARNYDLASRKARTAIEEIDKAIASLQKTKEALLGSENNLRLGACVRIASERESTATYCGQIGLYPQYVDVRMPDFEYRHTLLANDKARDVTIKRLTKNNPTMEAKFAALGTPAIEATNADTNPGQPPEVN